MGGDATLTVSKRKLDNLCTVIGCIIALVIISLGLALVNIIASVPDISYLIFAHISLAILIAIGGICTGICVAKYLYKWLCGEEMTNSERTKSNEHDKRAEKVC